MSSTRCGDDSVGDPRCAHVEDAQAVLGDGAKRRGLFLEEHAGKVTAAMTLPLTICLLPSL